MGNKLKVDIGLGKAAVVNALGNMAAQSLQAGRERDARKEAQEQAKINEIEAFVFSSDYTEFAKQFLGMEDDYKNVVKEHDLDNSIAKAYQARMEKEIHVITATNPDLYTKAKPMFDEFKESLNSSKAAAKKKNIIIWIIAAAIFAVSGIGLCLQGTF